jgi:uncharacterized protein
MKMRHSKNRFAVLALAMLSLVQSAEARRLKVLFLGHKPGMHAGHLTDLRYMDLLQGMVPRGVDMDYSDDPATALTSATLAKYDALSIYANWEKITPEQEKALFEYVESGHGFVPIHCASYCFLNSMKYTQMVGARFKSHITGEFDITTTAEGQQSPLLSGYKPFRTWDETYVHTLHNQDKVVLQRRLDPSRNEDEPWTWTRTQGTGRVFYTAYGHNEKTWSQSGFHELVYRGIKWAVGDTVAAEHAKLNLAPLEYVDGAEVPNYEKRTPAPQLQKPLEVAEAQKHISVPNGMELTLFASEQDKLWNVITFRFDEQGRMWTCESLDYPNERKPQGEGRDRVRILEDTNNDGKVDKATVFAEGLSIPTGLVFVDDGIVVFNLPDTTFLKDTNGDGKADEKKVLFTGWGVGDTHACPSSLTYGFDGWIYGCVGYGGFDGTVGGKQHKFGQGAFRFKKDGSEMDYLGRTSNNTWGFGFNENGDIFGSTANGQSSFYCPIPQRYYATVPGMNQGILKGVDANKRAPIAREYVRQVDWFNGFTAAACHNFYTARSFPSVYWNAVAFVAEPTCHLLYQAVATQTGTNFTMGNGMNLMASDDEWFAPVHADVGPDGSVYISDFYSFLIQHNPTPSVERGGFKAKTGEGNAFISTLRDTERARLWKLTYKDGKPSETYKLSKKEPATLVKALSSDNLLWRSHAQRLLVERGKTDVAGELKTLVADQKVDAVGVNGGAFGAVWALAGLKALDASTLEKALKHPASGVRRAALQNLPRTAEGRDMLMKSGAIQELEPLVRLTALLTLSEMPSNGAVGVELQKLGKNDATISKDEWLAPAFTIAAAKHALGYLGAALANAEPKNTATTTMPKESANIMANAGFESSRGDRPEHWRVRNYGGKAEHAVDAAVSHGGKSSLRISSEEGSDTSFHWDADLLPGTDYEWSGWIKTKDLSTSGGAKGAMLEIHSLNGEQPHTKPLKGNVDWTEVKLKFNTGKQTRVSFNLLFGGWGPAKGTAWWDDMKLVSLGAGGGDGSLAQIASAFAATAPADAKSALAKVAAAKPSDVSTLVLNLLNSGGAAVKIETLEELAKTHQVLKLDTIAGGMKYDKPTLTAKAGKPIVLQFINSDALQHNVVVGQPGSFSKIEQGAMKMMTAPDGATKGYVPAIPEVLGSCPMIEQKQQELIKLPALKPGKYPYVCTFPAHAAIMKGELIVE